MTPRVLTLPFDRPAPLEPPPAYARLRASAPVTEVRTPDGLTGWLVTSYEAVATVLSDRRFRLAPPGEPSPGNDTLFQDGTAHLRLRRLVSRAFTPRSVNALRPRVEQLAEEYVTALTDAGPPGDLVAGLSAPLSVTVISELLGVPHDERDHFRQLADAVSAVDLVFGGEENAEAVAEAWNALGAYTYLLVTTKRAEPGPDLLSALITVRDAEDGRLSDNELVATATSLVATGYLSACNAISVGTMRLLAEGALPALATADTATVSATVEELLRLQAGRTGEPLPRYAHEGLELAGVPIAAGDQVLVRLEAANRDPERFPDPDRLVPGRTGRPLPFGHGPHYCLGASLARIEVASALTALARRLPGLRLHGRVEDVEWTRNAIDIGPTALPLSW
ncbi:cytochrome P450 [Streptomyces sp. NPDC005438]|uniref:cytochrome P450 n=1 Tax=Streptomyces sp. NPDC005438 TaxID=3156880 RepID=UPI0033BBDE79